MIVPPICDDLRLFSEARTTFEQHFYWPPSLWTRYQSRRQHSGASQQHEGVVAAVAMEAALVFNPLSTYTAPADGQANPIAIAHAGCSTCGACDEPVSPERQTVACCYADPDRVWEEQCDGRKAKVGRTSGMIMHGKHLSPLSLSAEGVLEW
jgi:hypothetical protein